MDMLLVGWCPDSRRSEFRLARPGGEDIPAGVPTGKVSPGVTREHPPRRVASNPTRPFLGT